MLHGIINVYKEPGFTSFDVVAKLRGICKQKKIGHTGTLDPAAKGVLPVCLGNATKLCDMLTDKVKVYEAELILGIDTDTEDTTGTVLHKEELNALEPEVREAMLSFLGTYEQIPPMYSAIKVNGKRLYDLAREGKEIERAARTVTIHEMEILEMALPRVRFRVKVSKGTYIRSLCRDIGHKLGSYGCMESLVRLQSGNFTIEEAYTLAEIEALAQENRLEEILFPLERAFADLKVLQVRTEYKKLIDNGNPLPREAVTAVEAAPGDAEGMSMEGQRFRIYNAEGKFFAVYEWSSAKGQFMPYKIFPLE